jgi:hypothetical protein
MELDMLASSFCFKRIIPNLVDPFWLDVNPKLTTRESCDNERGGGGSVWLMIRMVAGACVARVYYGTRQTPTTQRPSAGTDVLILLLDC